MKMKKAIALAVLCLAPALAAAEERPWSNGPVTAVTYVKVKAGKFDDYMAYLGVAYRKQMEASMKAGLVSNWHVYTTQARNPNEPDLILTVTYPNMGTLDKQKEFDAVATSVSGPIAEMNKGFADRSSMREVLGGDLIREVILR